MSLWLFFLLVADFILTSIHSIILKLLLGSSVFLTRVYKSTVLGLQSLFRVRVYLFNSWISLSSAATKNICGGTAEATIDMKTKVMRLREAWCHPDLWYMVVDEESLIELIWLLVMSP